MAIINLSEIPKEKIEALAAKGVLGGLLVEEIEHKYEKDNWFYLYFVTSRSDKSKTHDVVLYTEGFKWFGTCDQDINDDDACKANRVGEILCGHVAVAYLELERKFAAPVGKVEDE